MASLKQHVKENPAMSLVIAVMTVLSTVNIGAVVQTVRYVDSLATNDEVSHALAEERTYAAAQLADHVQKSDETFKKLGDSLDRVRAFTEVVPELRNLIALKCMGTRNLDDTIDRLKREYAVLTGEAYSEPACDRLLSPR